MNGEAAESRRSTLGRQHLPRHMRLRKRADYLAIQAQSKKASGRHYTILASLVAGGPAPRWRLGVTVSRKVGNAVIRNRVKRWIRESFRRAADRRVPGFALVVIARPSAASSSYEETLAELSWLLARLLGRR